MRSNSIWTAIRTIPPSAARARRTLSGNLLPLTLFPDSWQRVISFLPYSQVLDAPIRLYTGEWALAQAPRALGIQCAWIVILIILGLWLWRKNQKRLIVQGG